MGDDIKTTPVPPVDLPSGAVIYVTMFSVFGALAAFVIINWICMKREMRAEKRAALRGESGSRHERDEEEEVWINPGQTGSVVNTVRNFFGGIGGRSTRYSRLDVEDSASHETTKLIEFDQDDLKQT